MKLVLGLLLGLLPSLALAQTGVQQAGPVTPGNLAVWQWNGIVRDGGPPTSSGTVTDVSVATSNGFAGSVASSTTTPVITLQTTISGLIKGNGSALLAATPGTDYYSPGNLPVGSNSTQGILRCDGVTASCPSGIISLTGSGSGSVTSVSGNSVNGFAWSIANPSTTPALTLSVTPSGVLKGNGTAIAAAVPGTDYLSPTGSGAGLTGILWSQIGSTPTTLAGYGITDGATSGANSNITSLTGLITPLAGSEGGTGVANTGKTIALGGNVSTIGAFPLAITLTGSTALTFPTSGTLAGTGTAQTWTALQTYTNSDWAMLGSSTGKTAITSDNSSATNYTMHVIAASGAFTYLPTGVTPVNTHCAVWFGTQGALTDNGSCPSTITVNDGLGNTFTGINNLTLLGGILTNPSTSLATYTPQTTDRLVTSGGSAPIVAGDAGNVVLYNNSGLTSALAALSASYIPAGQSVTVCNPFAATLAGTSVNPIVGYPTGGTAGAYTFSVSAPQNGVQTCLGLLSDGTTLYDLFSIPPNIMFTTVQDQTVTGGFVKTPFANAGTSGAIAIDCGKGDLQTLTNNGAITMTMTATSPSQCWMQVTNGASAGAITWSGFTVGSNVGDAFTTTNTSKFLVRLTQISGVSSYFNYALQAASSTFAPVASANWSAVQTGTSGAVATTGARVEVVAVSWNGTAVPVLTLTDSLTNAWTGPTTATNGAVNTSVWYCVSCSVGAAQTFTITSTANSFFNAGVQTFSSPTASIDGAIVVNNAGNAPTVASGSKTPAGAGDLFITAVASSDTGAAISAASPFTVGTTAAVASLGGGDLGFGMAYFVNGASSAENASWTIAAGTNGASALILAFKP